MLRENDKLARWDEPQQNLSQEMRDRRKALGIYYTPPEAAKVLAQWLIRHPGDIVLEPSFGGCAMLSAAVTVFRDLDNPAPSAQLYGYDVDPEAFAHLAQMGLHNDGEHFKKKDFLCSEAGDLRVDAVLANPPFVSYHRQTIEQRKLTDKLRQRYFPKLPRFASLWAYFVLHATSFLRPGGRMAFVLPNAIGTADYGRALLDHLRHKFRKVELVNVHERLFIQVGADEKIAVLLLSDFTPDGCEVPAPLIGRHILRISELASDDFAPTQPVQINGSAQTQQVQDIFAHLAAKCFAPLGTYANVQIGEVVGDIPFFVRPLAEWKAEGISSQYLFPLLTRATQVTGISVLEDAGSIIHPRIPHLLVPPEKVTAAAIKKYLTRYAPEDVASNKTFQKRAVWYRCSYDGGAHAFLGAMHHNWPRIIGNDGKVSCSNSFYKITVTDNRPLIAWLPIIGLTTPFRLSAELLGRVRGSGGIKLEPSDARKLLVPSSLPKLKASEFKNLRNRIHELVCSGEIDAASQLADATLYLKLGTVDSKKMFELRQERLALSTRRLTKL